MVRGRQIACNAAPVKRCFSADDESVWNLIAFIIVMIIPIIMT